MQRSDFLAGLTAVAAGVSTPLAQSTSVAGIALPQSAAALEAAALAKSVLPVEIYDHSLRTFFFAELLGRALRLEHDSELVYIASILHDTGLASQIMSKEEHFQVDGANLSRKILAAHAYDAAKADVTWDAIALHDQGAIARWKSNEVLLVSAGVSADFGARLNQLSRADVLAVLAEAPRSNFIPVFLAAVSALIAHKPSNAAPSWLTDVAVRTVHGIHYENFVDAITADDPFSSYR